MTAFHTPVMVDEVLALLAPTRGTILDATVGGGGHAAAILAAAPGVALVGCDADPDAIAAARRSLAGHGDRVRLFATDFAGFENVLRGAGVRSLTGALFDLGVSLHQLMTPARGFSYLASGPLDMRFNPSQLTSARSILRSTSAFELGQLLRRFGEEPRARRLAEAIHTARRRLETTDDLARLVRSLVPARGADRTLARTFQALRIAVNAELDQLTTGLAGALRLLAPNGRLVALAYHSLEDRIVKQTLRAGHRAGTLTVLTPRPLRPSPAEVAANRAARSARLRAARKN